MNGKNAVNSNFLNDLPPEHIIIGVLVLIILYLMFYQDNKISYDDTYNTSCNSSSNEHFTDYPTPVTPAVIPTVTRICKRKAKILGVERCVEWGMSYL